MVIEELADYIHTMRSKRYLHQKDNSFWDNVTRRNRQASTNYSGLSEEEKEKDRKFARDILLLVKPLFKVTLDSTSCDVISKQKLETFEEVWINISSDASEIVIVLYASVYELDEKIKLIQSFYNRTILL